MEETKEKSKVSIRDYNGTDNEVEIVCENVGPDIGGKGKIEISPPTRWLIRAFNQGGFDSTVVDLLDVLKWVKTNKPELFDEIE